MLKKLINSLQNSYKFLKNVELNYDRNVIMILRKDDTTMKESLIEYLQMMLQDYEYNKDDDECMIGDCELIKNILHIVNIIEAMDEQMITKLCPTMSDVLEMYIKLK